ncbi:biliverdin-producing heme oxygenase [uncultured Sphingomonas sp.]|uniref:biliverdin-producing heme oxygenase n=1 Tax=uncultured Sphingomonas sp. TaxID=158754 RepID=UPI0025E32FD2|nr:biliverdin-producing heme oxygenase [uncultured Sphingomonas sp.]
MTPITSQSQPSAPMAAPARPISRSQRLMQATRSAHDGLDNRIISAEPFQDRDHYVRLLEMQYRFHRGIEGLYSRSLPLPATLDLPARRRLDRVRQDLEDLGRSPPENEGARPLHTARVDAATAIGWLWVAEGSTLGAASLLKRAAALGLDETFGARHLAGHPDGRAKAWKHFTAAIDALDLDQVDDALMLGGARDAFLYARRLADASFA